MQKEIFSQGIMPHSRAVLSSRSRVFGPTPAAAGKGANAGSAFELIGAISSFGISSSRTLETVRGIGMGDHIIEIVPGQSEPIELQITKFAMSLANTFQEFGYRGGVDGLVRALKHHRYPIDIKHELLISTKIKNSENLPSTSVYAAKQVGNVGTTEDDLSDFQVLVTWFEGCWFESFSVTYPIESAAISEESSLKVTDVSGNPDGKIVLPDSNFYNSRIWGGQSSI